MQLVPTPLPSSSLPWGVLGVLVQVPGILALVFILTRAFPSKPSKKCQNPINLLAAFKMHAAPSTVSSPILVKSPMGRIGPGDPYALLHSPSLKGDPNVFLSGASKYDQDNQKCAQHVASYSAEIFQHMFLSEVRVSHENPGLFDWYPLSHYFPTESDMAPLLLPKPTTHHASNATASR